MDVNIKEVNIIIITQSCDLLQRKTDTILVCTYYTLEQLESVPFFKNPVGKEVLRRGNIVYLHLLNKCILPGWESSFIVVDFRKVYSIDRNLLNEISINQGTRLRLLSPYREQLSQSFARYIMRVGLPTDIPPFANEIYQLEIKSTET